MVTRALPWIAMAAGTAGCILPEPSYDDTRFRCEAPSMTCPDGFTCVAGWCEPEGQGDGDVDGAPEQDSPDAGPVAPPDARPTMTTSFGERPGADVSGVTTDTTLRADDPATGYGGDDIVGIDADPVHIGLLRFDLTTLPADAEVLEAELDIFSSNPIETGAYQIHAMAVPWDEGDATFDDARTGVPWPAPGAGGNSFAATLIGALQATEIAPYTVPLAIPAVQTWVSAPGQNQGMRWSSSSPDGRGGNFPSSESLLDEKRPLLRITWR